MATHHQQGAAAHYLVPPLPFPSGTSPLLSTVMSCPSILAATAPSYTEPTTSCRRTRRRSSSLIDPSPIRWCPAPAHTVISHQSSVISHLPSVGALLQPTQSSVISHQSSVISHQHLTSVGALLQPTQSSVISHQSSVINHPSSVIRHPSSAISRQSAPARAVMLHPKHCLT
jgi:hypothetical protein